MICCSSRSTSVVYPDSTISQTNLYEKKVKTTPNSPTSCSIQKKSSSFLHYFNRGKHHEVRIEPSSMAISLDSIKDIDDSTKGTQSISKQPSKHIFIKPNLLKELSRELSNLKIDLIRVNSVVSINNSISSRKRLSPTMKRWIGINEKEYFETTNSSSKKSTKEMIQLLDHLLHSYLNVMTVTNQDTTNTIKRLLTKLHCFELMEFSEDEIKEIISQIHEEFSQLVQSEL